MVPSRLCIVKYPHPALRKQAAEIKSINAEVRKLTRKMFETMYAEKGMGLAANQVAHLQKLTVVTTGGEHPDELVLVNPTIVEGSGELMGVEGCLSMPGIEVEVPRYQTITVRGYDLQGKEIEIEADELLSRVLQHELDHLDGIMLVDKMSPAARIACRQTLRELERAYHDGGQEP